MKLLPRSLFGRILLVLAAGLLLAQACSVVINLFDRGSAVYLLAQRQIAARVAQAARILNRLPPAERTKVVEEINGPHLKVALAASPLELGQGYAEHDRYEAGFVALLRQQLAAPWPIRVNIVSRPRTAAAAAELATSSRFELWLARHFYFLLPNTFTIVAQVGLEDGSVAAFDAVIPQEPLRRLESLIPQLLLLLAVCFTLAALLVRMITRSLDRLARSAQAAGGDPAGPPLAAAGASELRPVVDAFNELQARMQGYVQERARIVSAMSHDLRTPITRLRLRAEMLPEGELREKMLRDLQEMDAMVRSTLEFFGGLARGPARQPVDIAALVESLCEDRAELGQRASVQGAPCAPFPGHAPSLRRCLDNLIENAVRYGERAEIRIDDSARLLRIAVRDYGPGVPAEEAERVFEPFYRLETSRSRESGGTGLGLSIARSIARWHGGDVKLHNAPASGGLVAELALPRGVWTTR